MAAAATASAAHGSAGSGEAGATSAVWVGSETTSASAGTAPASATAGVSTGATAASSASAPAPTPSIRIIDPRLTSFEALIASLHLQTPVPSPQGARATGKPAREAHQGRKPYRPGGGNA